MVKLVNDELNEMSKILLEGLENKLSEIIDSKEEGFPSNLMLTNTVREERDGFTFLFRAKAPISENNEIDYNKILMNMPVGIRITVLNGAGSKDSRVKIFLDKWHYDDEADPASMHKLITIATSLLFNGHVGDFNDLEIIMSMVGANDIIEALNDDKDTTAIYRELIDPDAEFLSIEEAINRHKEVEIDRLNSSLSEAFKMLFNLNGTKNALLGNELYKSEEVKENEKLIDDFVDKLTSVLEKEGLKTLLPIIDIIEDFDIALNHHLTNTVESEIYDEMLDDIKNSNEDENCCDEDCGCNGEHEDNISEQSMMELSNKLSEFDQCVINMENENNDMYYENIVDAIDLMLSHQSYDVEFPIDVYEMVTWLKNNISEEYNADVERFLDAYKDYSANEEEEEEEIEYGEEE